MKQLNAIDKTKKVYCIGQYNNTNIYAVYENKPHYVGKWLFQGDYKAVKAYLENNKINEVK